MIDFEIDSKQLNQMALGLAATEAQAVKALRRTLNRMATWLRVQDTKGLSKTLQIQQKIIRRRLKSVKFKQLADGGVSKVWYGLNAVDLMWLHPKKTGVGIQTDGGRVVAGAFLGKTKSGKTQVFKRSGKARLPILKQLTAIAPQSESYLQTQTITRARFEAQFWKTFEHELKWQTK